MATYTKTITVTRPSGSVTGTLVVNTSVNPNTGTFTPTPSPPGALIDCSGAPVWTENANGTINFGFEVGTGGNGNFGAGTYRFNGTQQANGNPSGTVVWPAGLESDEDEDSPEDEEEDDDDDGPEGVETDAWQASG